MSPFTFVFSKDSVADDGDESEDEDSSNDTSQGWFGLRLLAIVLWGPDSPTNGEDDEHNCEKCKEDACNPAIIYCVDCEAGFCSACSGRWHHPGTSNELHSLEEIDKTEPKGLKILTPLMDEICFAIGIYYLFGHEAKYLTPNYLSRADICPVVHMNQRMIAWVDTVLFYQCKEMILEFCGKEDTFWKLILDAWVRTVITDSDSLLLLLKTLPSALLIQMIASTFLVPILAVIYATLLILLQTVESALPRSLWVLRLAAKVTRKLSAFSSRFVSFSKSRPMRTKARLRPSQDIYEMTTYWFGRHKRLFEFYYKATGECVTYFISYAVRLVVFVRCLGIFMNAGWAFRWWLEGTGMQETIALHKQWFGRASNMLDTDHIIFTGLMSVGTGGLRFLWSHDSQVLFVTIFGILALAAIQVAFRMRVIRRRWVRDRRFQRRVVLPLLLFMVAVPGARIPFCVAVVAIVGIVWLADYVLRFIIERQQEKFNELWQANYRSIVLGDCPCLDGKSLCPCPCTWARPVESSEASLKKRRKWSRVWKRYWGKASKWYQNGTPQHNKRLECGENDDAPQRMETLDSTDSLDALAVELQDAVIEPPAPPPSPRPRPPHSRVPERSPSRLKGRSPNRRREDTPGRPPKPFSPTRPTRRNSLRENS